jgi:aspartyl-tRNA(Asn)/glutamyl-tRNA(Gln) amidotransferase subunit B
MAKPLEPVIGLEIHVQLKTKSKMFCSCANIFGDVPPNSAICPICLGYPGTLPVPNAAAVEGVRKAGAALNCKLATKSKFDRKSYFYPDLPKGYQISQYDQPFCGKGKLAVIVDGKEREIGITRIHLEEDAAKNIHPAGKDHTLVDYNRAGTPLIEIVTEPDIKTPAEAKVFLQELQRIMRALDISDANMEEGQLRCDANISMRKVGTKKLNPKTEVKNLNSFRNVERALEHEIKRQTKLWEGDEVPEHATRGWDADKQKTIEQRTKEEAADYRYFPEPDIPPFSFTAEENKAIHKQLPELPPAKRDRFKRQYGLGGEQAHLLVDAPELAHFFEDVMSELEQQDQERVEVNAKDIKKTVPLAANLIVREIRRIMAEPEKLNISAENFAEVVLLLQQGKVNKNGVTKLLDEMQRTGGDPDPLIEKLGLAQVSGEDQLLTFVKQVIEENPEVVAKIKEGKASAIQFLMGQVMAKTRGTANPKVIIELLKQHINKAQE